MWPWLAVAICIVGTLVLGLLNVLGAGTGPIVNVVTVLMLITGFIVAIVKALAEELRHARRLTRVLFVVAVIVSVGILLVAGLLTRTIAPLHRMTGTADVAVIGVEAPSQDQQQSFDDLSSTLADSLPPIEGGQIHNYTAKVDPPPPLHHLRPSGDRAVMDRWLTDFLPDSGAELVVAGYSESGLAGQTKVHTAIHIPGRMVLDAAELSGWHTVSEHLADRRIDSTRSRRALLEAIVFEFRDLSAFLQGLDDLRAGYAAEAVTAFGLLIPIEQSDAPSRMQDLARLFRGHALELQSQFADPRERNQLLALARADYAAVATPSIVARARMSLATNDYLTAVQTGCIPGAKGMPLLRRSTAALAEVSADLELPELLRLRAEVNRSQVELCLLRAGDRTAAGRLDPLLVKLTGLTLQPVDLDYELKSYVKALALSVQAIRFARGNRLPDALVAIEAAVQLDGRAERSAFWFGFKGRWLLDLCRMPEAQIAQAQSLSLFEAAVKSGRLPDRVMQTFANAFARDLEEAEKKCQPGKPR